jgi:minor histocompatibility antigen H13
MLTSSLALIAMLFECTRSKRNIMIHLDALRTLMVLSLDQMFYFIWMHSNFCPSLKDKTPISQAKNSVIIFTTEFTTNLHRPMMVTVAKSLDVPIKLIIPRAENPNRPGVPQYSMLGLGDIVLPGMMIGLALRYDLYRHYLVLQENDAGTTASEVPRLKPTFIPPKSNWSSQFWTSSWFGSRSTLPPTIQTGSFSKIYFWVSVIGYTIGMVTTLVVMQWYKHAQPALLYLVPAVLLSLAGTAIVRGETKQMWNFSEAEEEELNPDHKGEKPKSTEGLSVFSEEKSERNEAKIKKSLSKYVQQGESESEDEPDEAKSSAKVDKMEKKFRRDKNHDLVFFAITRHAPLQRSHKDKDTNTEPKWTAHEEGEVERSGKRQRIG